MFPKYSVVLPVLNGEETLPVVLNHLLSIEYDDFEVIVSDNLSSDNTAEILDKIHDRRLKVVQPNKRLGWSENLAFAYSHASGMWQHHIGDDDVVLPSRFKILDQIIDMYPETDLIWSRGSRYHWPNYGEKSLANKMDAISFSGAHAKLPKVVRDAVIRGKAVEAGYYIVTSKRIIDTCINKYKFFVTRQHGEAFSHRAALVNSKEPIILDLPLAISGRHKKSIATQHLQPKTHYIDKCETDIAHSDPDEFQLIPWKYKGYISWSLDALCLLIAIDKNIPPLNDSEWLAWCYMVVSELKSLKAKGQICNEDSYFNNCLENKYKDIMNLWEKRKIDLVSKNTSTNTFWPAPNNTRMVQPLNRLTSIPAMDVNHWNVSNISHLAYTLEEKLPLFYGHKGLPPVFPEINRSSPLAKGLEIITKNSIQCILPSQSVSPLVAKLDFEIPCDCTTPKYVDKYIEFESALKNYQYNNAGKCNAPVIISYEHNDVKSIHNSVEKLDRILLPPPDTKLIESSTSRYELFLYKIRSLKDKYKDISALVIGNGPSQEMLDWNSLENFKNNGNHIYSVNFFIHNKSLLKELITHYVTADYLMFSKQINSKLVSNRDNVFKYLDKYQPVFFAPIHIEYDLKPHCDITYFEARHRHAWEGGSWEPDRPRRYWSNTLLFTLAISRFLGYKQVYVIGNDTSYPQCVRVAPDNELAIIESHACLENRITQGYPLSSNMSKYMTLLSYWFWSYGYICDKRFFNLDPLSLVDSIQKIQPKMTTGWSLLNRKAQYHIKRVISKYQDVTAVNS